MSEEKERLGKVEAKKVDPDAAFSRLARERGLVVFAGHVPVIMETLLVCMEIIAALSDFIADSGREDEAVLKRLCDSSAREALVLLGSLVLAFGEAKASIERGNVVFMDFSGFGVDESAFAAERAPKTIH